MIREQFSQHRRFTLSVAALAVWICGAQALPSAAGDTALEESLAAEVAHFVQADRAAPQAPCQVLFVGSSSIVKWTTLARDMAPLPVINRGFGGSHIEYVNRWFPKVVAPYRPRSIVFYAGENDLDAGKSVDRVVADFDEFMTLKTRALGSTPVYFVSLKPSILRFAQWPLQRRVNAAIRALAGRRKDLYFIDVATPMLDHGKPKPIFGPDGLHMNADGYAIWTAVITAAMRPHVEAEASACRGQDAG